MGVLPAADAQPALLLLDIVSLNLPHEAAEAAAAAAADPGEDEIAGSGNSSAAAAATIGLAQDAAAPELLYAVHSSGAHAVTLTWLPLLAGLMAEEGGAPPQLPAALPQPSAELLRRSTAGLVAAAPVGDTLSGSALVVLEASGKALCLRPHRAARAAEDAAAAAGTAGAAGAAAGVAATSSAAQRDVEAQIATIYGDLRRGGSALYFALHSPVFWLGGLPSMHGLAWICNLLGCRAWLACAFNPCTQSQPSNCPQAPKRASCPRRPPDDPPAPAI